MTLRDRILMMVSVLVILLVIAMTLTMNWTARQSLLRQAEADVKVIASLLARSATFAEQLPRDVDAAIGDQMVVEATIAAHLVAIAEQAGLSPEEINQHLQQITAQTVLNEFWITDESGHAYLRNIPEIDFTFSPDPQLQPQASVFWALIDGKASQVIQEARVREVDDQVFKYVGVSGIDRPRIVQVGYHASFLDQLRQMVGIDRLLESLVSGGDVLVIRILDREFNTLALQAARGQPVDPALHPADRELLDLALNENRTIVILQPQEIGKVPLWLWGPAWVRQQAFLQGSTLRAAAPITDLNGQVIGAAVVYLPTEAIQISLRRQWQLALVLMAGGLFFGIVASMMLARRVTRPIDQLRDAAAAVEAGRFDPASLSGLTQRPDELGKLAQVFTRMALEVRAREQGLIRQVQALQIEIDEVRKKQQVEEITGTRYFQELQQRADRFRRRSDESPEGEKGTEEP